MRENAGESIVKGDKVKARTFTLSDIKEGSSYEIRVSAVNKAGQGPASVRLLPGIIISRVLG